MQHCCRLLLMRRLSGEEIELSQASRDEVCSLCTRWSSSRVQQEQDNAHNTSGLGGEVEWRTREWWGRELQGTVALQVISPGHDLDIGKENKPQRLLP